MTCPNYPKRNYAVSGLHLGYQRVLGLDEAGRGPMAGPVVVAGVILKSGWSHPLLKDSKQLSPENRQLVFDEIMKHCEACAVVFKSAPEVDRLNIYEATRQAMMEIVRLLQPDYVLTDALPLDVNVISCPVEAIVKGDQLVKEISAASIVAKVLRDRYMAVLDLEYPEYQFGKHKGYVTALHLALLKQFGPINEHRRSFKPVLKVVQDIKLD